MTFSAKRPRWDHVNLSTCTAGYLQYNLFTWVETQIVEQSFFSEETTQQVPCEQRPFNGRLKGPLLAGYATRCS